MASRFLCVSTAEVGEIAPISPQTLLWKNAIEVGSMVTRWPKVTPSGANRMHRLVRLVWLMTVALDRYRLSPHQQVSDSGFVALDE
ncbi:hypothetical protein FJ938_02030 [Mesorhizobium sp. B2-4-14]|uniref:hypothetical protein n=1 Tax=Mesorhizobium sp. B2-4-14 TaxID=2589935 RepID=UPI00112D099D|nr:hypothetical protein [Mesorhizobium sp. B2-4-14]TPL11529.1 hypothetical protein FJ938_02030 [Mesorhizobium sp. B2-4-14]